jgi:hypothetical protein
VPAAHNCNFGTATFYTGAGGGDLANITILRCQLPSCLRYTTKEDRVDNIIQQANCR